MLLINATVCPMDKQDIAYGYVQINEGRITGVGAMEQCPQAAIAEEVLDLTGRQIFPGFIDAHSHIGLYENGLGFEGDDLNEDTDPSTPHLRALDGINPLDGCFGEAVSSGVTCVVVSPGSANPIGGQIVALKTVGRWIDQMVVKEPLAMKFAFGENPKSVYNGKTQAPVTRMATAAVIREQLARALRYMEEKEAAEKDPDGAPPDLDMKCEALLPLLKKEMRAHIHAHRAYDILTGVRIAKEFALDYTIIHCTEGHMIAEELAQVNAKVVCGPIPSSRTKPELSNMLLENCARLAAVGIPVAISTDHPEVPVDFLAPSAAIAMAHGLERRKALESITLAAAKAVGLDDRVGSISVGKDADLQVYLGDPLIGYNKPEMVFIDGRQVK